MEERKCLVCGEVLSGRTDKKFCSNECRTYYNNRRLKNPEAFPKGVRSARYIRSSVKKLSKRGGGFPLKIIAFVCQICGLFCKKSSAGRD